MSSRLDRVFQTVDEKLLPSLTEGSTFDRGYFVHEKDVTSQIQKILSEIDFETVKQLKNGILNKQPLSFEKTVRTIQQIRNQEQSHESQVQRLVRNLTEKEIIQVAKLKFSDDPSIKKIASLIHSCTSYFDIVEDDYFGPYAFAAYSQKLISRAQHTSVLIHWAARSQFGGIQRSYSFFDKENCDQFLRPALYKLNPSELERLYCLMQKVELSEQKFSVIRCDRSTISQGAFAFATALNVLFPLFHFGHDTEFDQITIVVPSFSLLQAYLNAVFGDDAINLEPEIRTSTWENIERDFIQNLRPLLVPFPLIENTYDVDGHVGVGLYLAMLHDFYHAVRLSTMPKNHRMGIVRHIHLLRHYIDVSISKPKSSLLNAYSQEGVFAHSTLNQDEITQTEEDIEELLDGETPSQSYYKWWLRHKGGSLIQKPYFAATFNSDDFLSRVLPDKFQTDGFIYDSVMNEKGWKQLGLDVRMEKSNWAFGDAGPFSHQSAIFYRYAGFKKLLKFM